MSGNRVYDEAKNFDVAIIGGGILGTSISYWLSTLYDIRICVIEKERDVGMHSSSRNTGVVHSPFYLNPKTKATMARAAYISHEMWRSFAQRSGVAWRSTGTIQVAMNESQHDTLVKYAEWGMRNGLDEEDLALLDSAAVSKMEPNLRCHSGLFCRRDASTDYGALTASLREISRRNGVIFIHDSKVSSIEPGQRTLVRFAEGGGARAGLVINCAGGNSLDVAHLFGLATEYTDLHFRGEYWRADPAHSEIVGTNVYSVAEFPEFPFLDPHWIRRANGDAEVGPNAVPVPSPETYDGLVPDVTTAISKFAEIVTSGARNLLTDPDFVSLAYKEFLSSVSKTAMIRRVKKFIPCIDPDIFTARGTSGIRTPVISRDGKFVPDVMELEGDDSFHIVNYNSPGATGAPAYSAYVVKKLRELGFLGDPSRPRRSIWNFDDCTCP